MTQPALATPVLKMGRMYPFPPADLSDIPRNRWGSIDLTDAPATTAMLPSVTNVLGIVDKPGLRGWYAEMALRAAWDSAQVDTLTDPNTGEIGDLHYLTEQSLDAFIKRYKWAANKKRDERAEAGTRAHTIAEVLTLDAPLPADVSEMDEQYADAFMAWWSEHDVEPVFTEQTVAWIDATNPKIGYAGTADGFGYLKGFGGLQVYDFKSKAGAPDDKKIKRYGLAYEENRLQLAALAQAQYRYVEQDGGWGYDDLPVVAGGMVVALYESGDFRVEHVPGESLTQAGAAFIGLLVARRWQLGFDVAQEVMW